MCAQPQSNKDAKEPPLALILSATGAQIQRADCELPLAAKPGEALFAGDSLYAAGGTAVYVSCTANTQQGLSPDGEVLFEPKQSKLRKGKFVDQKPATGCFLPPLQRSIVASQQHAGASVASDLAGASPARIAGQNPQLGATLAPLDQAIQADSMDLISRLARTAALENAGLLREAAAEMRQVATGWPDPAWMRSRVYALELAASKSAPAPASTDPASSEGQTFALLIGISNFSHPEVPKLQFAHLDALDFAKLLQSPRAGAIPPDNIKVLVNENATRSAIQSAIETHLKRRASKNDTVLLFIASHGVTFPVGNKTKGFVIAYDTDPADPATSGVPMEDIRRLFESDLTNVKRLLLYVDVCHAGRVGQIIPKADVTNKTAERSLAPEDVQMFGLLAAQSNQVAIEGVNYGGGHGAFTYFLMRALNGDADLNRDGKVMMPEFFDFVRDKVSETTASRQIPKQIGDIDEKRIMANTGMPGIELKDYAPPAPGGSRGFQAVGPAGETARDFAPQTVMTSRLMKYQDAATLVELFEKAIREGRILPTDNQSAFELLGAMKSRLKAEDYPAEAAKLRVALEDKGQQVLLEYLAGDATPQKRESFFDGTRYFEAAELLAPDSLFLESRKVFCQGRVAIFDKDYRRAAELLERAVGMDPERAYSYNALGIAYLERADYDRAVLAFRDATRRAPYWAYPLHNLALALSEKGAFADAIRAYDRGMLLAPKAAYLPYNLGLLYQRMNRGKDAETMYRKALALDPANPQVLTALGYVKASAGKRGEAEDLYRQALAKDAASLTANHNLALLLSTDPKRFDEAVTIWRANLDRAPEHLPSRLSLARALARVGRKEDAVKEYEKLIAVRPEYVAARRALSDLFFETGKRAEALAQLQEALKVEPENVELLERAGDLYAAAGNNAEARAAYEKALPGAAGPAKKRIRAAIAKLK